MKRSSRRASLEISRAKALVRFPGYRAAWKAALGKPALRSFFIAIALLRMPCADASDLDAFRKLVVFGDSLSDNGNSFVATGKPALPYFDERWTNGPSARQFMLIDIPDISLTPDIIALGGATIQAAKQFVASVNSALQAKIPLVASPLGVQINLIDINTIFYINSR